MPERLPLFPLRTVLVPGLVLPLNVFEPRYAALVADLLERPEDERAFGVVALRSGAEAGAEHDASQLHAVGCTAVVRDVTELPDGRYELLTSGAVRFRLEGVDAAAGTPYLTGIVRALPEADPDDVATAAELTQLAADVGARWTSYRRRLGISTTGVAGGVPDDPAVLSYLVVAGMVLDVPARQELLEVPDTLSRLRAERRLLASEEAIIAALGAVPAQDLTAEPPNPN